jgi:hypothetical protein
MQLSETFSSIQAGTLPFHGIFKNLLKIILHSANLATAFIEV